MLGENSGRAYFARGTSVGERQSPILDPFYLGGGRTLNAPSGRGKETQVQITDSEIWWWKLRFRGSGSYSHTTGWWVAAADGTPLI